MYIKKYIKNIYNELTGDETRIGGWGDGGKVQGSDQRVSSPTELRGRQISLEWPTTNWAPADMKTALGKDAEHRWWLLPPAANSRRRNGTFTRCKDMFAAADVRFAELYYFSREL